MLFSQKNKGFFVELNDHAILLARTSEPELPFAIEEMAECPVNDAAALEQAIRQVQPKKAPSGYLHATVGVYPPKRLVRRHSLELKRVKEPGYFGDLFTQQFRIEQDKYTIAILNANDGGDYDLAKAAQKDAIFAGILNDEVAVLQDSLLAMGIYPERLELGSLSTLGGVVDYLTFTKSRTPTLVLEIGADATHSFIVSASGVEASRPIPQGIDAMLPVVQKELGLKDEDSAKKLFYSNTFDFTGMGPLLIKRLLKELQSSIGFYEVQTGQSVGQVLTMQLSPKQAWIDVAIAQSLGIASLKPDAGAWLQSRQVTVPETFLKNTREVGWFGLFSLMAHYNALSANAAAEEEKSDADVPLVPSWHPNFRNFDRLPDTKVVRTAFFINTVAVTVALVLVIYVGRSEWNLHVLRSQVAEQEQLINRDKAASDQAISLFKDYQKEEAKLLEIDTFVKSKPMVSQILLHLGQTLPKNIALDRFDLKPNGLTLAVTMRGAPTQAADAAKAYIDQLHADKELAIFEEPEQVSNGRNTMTGRITIELLLRLKGAEVKK